jgi:hypothetical protein
MRLAGLLLPAFFATACVVPDVTFATDGGGPPEAASDAALDSSTFPGSDAISMADQYGDGVAADGSDSAAADASDGGAGDASDSAAADASDGAAGDASDSGSADATDGAADDAGDGRAADANEGDAADADDGGTDGPVYCRGDAGPPSGDYTCCSSGAVCSGSCNGPACNHCGTCNWPNVCCTSGSSGDCKPPGSC